MNHGLPFYPHPGTLRAIICADGSLCPASAPAPNPTDSGINAAQACDALDKHFEPCGPHRVLLYEGTKYVHPDVQENEPLKPVRKGAAKRPCVHCGSEVEEACPDCGLALCFRFRCDQFHAGGNGCLPLRRSLIPDTVPDERTEQERIEEELPSEESPHGEPGTV